MKRIFAIINNHKNVDISTNILFKLEQFKNESYVFVFSNEEKDRNDWITYIKIPEEFIDHGSKLKNWVLNYIYSYHNSGFLHVIEDVVEIFNDPGIFLENIEEMITKMNIKTWFNTVTDPMNYTFKIYNPRFSIEIDQQEFKKKYDKTIYLTSHANTSWVAYNLNNSKYEEVIFDERFTIPMFYIIKFLADRRNNRKPGELSYMNLYPTIKEEQDVFRMTKVEEYNTHDEIEQRKKHIEESRLFNECNVNHDPTMEIETVMEDIIVNLS